MNVLSLFTGAGGLDLGLERAGFEIAGCVEIDPDCRKTLAKNRSWMRLEPGDILAHRPTDILSAFALKRRDVAILVGGPPCQPFSKSGQWRDGEPQRMSDPRSETLRAYLRVLAATLPDVMLLENVRGITRTRKRMNVKYEALDVLRSELKRINRRHGTHYDPIPLVIDAASFGVPQHRERVFLFATRDGAGLNVPDPSHFPQDLVGVNGNPRKRFGNAWDALWDLDDPEFDPSLIPKGAWGALLPSIPEGSNYLHHTPRGDGEPLFGWRRRYWSFLLKLAKARPSWTLQAQAGTATGPFHWRSRRLTTTELLRLQCFPDNWKVVGSATSVRRQLGNAVPPPVGEVLGLAISDQIFGARPTRTRRPLTPKLRADCPEPEPVEAVPAQYLGLRGQHDDHPGAGLGPGALARVATAN